MAKKNQATDVFELAKEAFRGTGKTAVAGAAAAILVAGNLLRSLKGKATETRTTIKNKFKKPEEETGMKKSTFAAILIALAAVAGVLAALYVYVLRREKELDEYEQLLFSEDFNDEIPPDATLAIDDED